MDIFDNDLKDIDKKLRDIIHIIKSRIEQFYYGLYDEMDEDEKKHFKDDLKNHSDLMYDSLNKSIIEKVNELSNLNKIISNINSELTEKNIELKENQVMKEFLFNIIIHDMKNPLASILGYLETLTLKQLEPQHFQRIVKSAYNSSLMLQNMISDLLDITKLEDNKFRIKQEYSFLSDIIEETLGIFELNITMKEITVKKDFLINEEIFIDKDVVKRIILNILSNSFKFVPTKGRIEIKTYFDKDKKRNIYISNNGASIPDNIKERLFDKFFSYQGDSKFIKGTGLGLTFCKMAVESFGGVIDVISPVENGVGVAFIIRF